MLRRVACAALPLFAMVGCTDTVLVDDVWDASIAPVDAAAVAFQDAASHNDRQPWGEPDGACGQRLKKPVFVPEFPEIMLVLDRSSNMQASFAGSSSKQAAVQSALSEAIADVQSRVWFGLELFPGDANTFGRPGGGGCAHSTCCAGEPTVEPQPSASGAISGLLTCNEQSGCDSNSSDSPSHKALEQVQTYLLGRSRYPWSQDQSVYVVLITATEPSCGSDSSGVDICGSARAQARSLGNADIPVVVVSVGYQADSNPNSCLAQISKQGTVTPIPGDTRLFVPMSLGGLKDNISTLFGAIARKSCTLSTYDVIPGYATPTVTVNDTTIPQDESDGWSFNSSRSQIKLSGAACDLYLKSPSGNLLVTYTCSICPGANACTQ
jgi:hypothetical protein